MIVQKICPHCGYDLVADIPIIINDFAMNGAGYPLFYKGVDTRLTPHQALVCWTLMKSYPEAVKKTTLIERIGTETDDPLNLANVYVSKIRSKFREIGAPPSIVTLHQYGAYVWDPRGGE